MHDTKGSLRKKDSVIVATSESQATLPPVTRRRFLETSLIAGAGSLLGTAPFARARQAPLLDSAFYKGMCYSAFPSPYDPSSANNTCIFSGSDIANNPLAPLWGSRFESANHMTWMGRNDLQTMQNMGVTLVRLYDWAPRNRHLNFLNYCQQLGIKVLAPVSNYFLIRGQGFENRETHIPNLIRSFSTTGTQNERGTDYHPAVAGIIIGNEPRISGFTVNECVQFTKDWVRIEQQQFSDFRGPPIGHPVDFHPYGGRYPSWGFFSPLLEGLRGTTIRDLQNRLFLAPNTFNDATYLFDNAESSGMGYVEKTYDQFHKPMLFTELGYSRSRCFPLPPPDKPCESWVANVPNYVEVVDGQLTRSIAYGKRHPEQLLGICHFQFDDKVWKCPTGDPPAGYCESEGAFGVHSHTNDVLFRVDYVPADFTIFDSGPCNNEHLSPDRLTRNPTFEKVEQAYKGP
jgi:hypothetical protein